MICRVCRKILYESEREFNNGMCWYCEQDAKEPDPYAGGMEPRSVFPLMDELEAEWGITDD